MVPTPLSSRVLVSWAGPEPAAGVVKLHTDYLLKTRYLRGGILMSLAQQLNDSDCSIIALDKFIQATRDSGYKGTTSAMSELVDNSIQAGAKRIAITLTADGASERENAIQVAVVDNGCGMDPFTLRQALRFGGSTRFGDRSGLGRYGMGLPNASLSQARRVSVYTWQAAVTPAKGKRSPSRTGLKPDRVFMSYLDVDEIVRGEMKEVPRPSLIKEPPAACAGNSGTLVLWSLCDRLDNRRISTLARKLETELARRFRHFLWSGLRITINGDAIKPFDPLYLNQAASISGATLFGEELRYEVHQDSDGKGPTAWVRVRFSELPVHEWHKRSNDEKRRIGVSKGAGVSIIRGGREVDYGWFFMGSKHRENYDDWWRCEIQFDPALDEAFGIAHTKQQVRPQSYLIDALTPDLEATARALNNRARKAHLAVKAGDRFSEAERVARERDHLLKPLPAVPGSKEKSLMRALEKKHAELRGAKPSKYTIIEATAKDTSFFSFAHDGKKFALLLNPEHPFFREIYKPLAEGDSPRDQQMRAKVELLLMAAARSEASWTKRYPELARFRLDWSNTLAAYLNET
jgi:Histidine kinase-, DNA gyrase B-, and HSP90-like ATPase